MTIAAFQAQTCAIPDGALLAAYSGNGAFADCYTVDTAGEISQERYIGAFLTTWPFTLERVILQWWLKKPSTAAQARELAAGTIDTYSAWRVEGRTADQLMLTDFKAQTKTWLMTVPIESSGGPATRLYFGSAILPRKNPQTGELEIAPGFRRILGFHRVYSKLLLVTARSRVKR